MELKDIKTGVKMVQLAFSIQIDREDVEMYSRLVLNRLKANNVTLEEFNSAIAHFIDTQDVNYKQLPTIAEMLKFCNKQPKTVEQMAKEQALFVWEGGYSYAEKVLFDNPTTNYVIQNGFGGLSKFRWKYINSSNENRISDNWGQKEFVEKWITAYEANKELIQPLCSETSKADSKLMIIGSIDKINTMLEHRPQENKTLDVVKMLGNSKKV